MPERQGTSPNAHFLAGDTPAPASLLSRWGRSLRASGFSLAAHVVVFALLLFIMTRPGIVEKATTAIPNYELVFLQQPGPGGGGGGGGNKSPEPPRKAEAEGADKITVPVAKPRKIENPIKPKDIPPVEQKMDIPVQQMASGVQQLPGVVESLPPTTSLANGTMTGAGGGTGAGMGPGSGNGLGPGSGGGTGGGVYQPGNGVTWPVLVKEVKPQYTGDAMRAKLQGTVEMQAVVLPDGSVGNVQITRSLDSAFGLDQEAIKAVKQWRFRPGLRNGQPVATLVSVELQFTLR
ncbi:MAG TPA: TonB family protein [Vicinamibacterales bacterium]|nr:TonB family protein [Vicinamibacterales bacterium]